MSATPRKATSMITAPIERGVPWVSFLLLGACVARPIAGPDDDGATAGTRPDLSPAAHDMVATPDLGATPDLLVPAPGSCRDGQKDWGESDIDCGGPRCPSCGSGKGCVVPDDCVSGVCAGGGCVVKPWVPAFLPPVKYPVYASPGGVAVGDLDGDRMPDLAVPCSGGPGTGNGTLVVLSNTGGGQFKATYDFTSNYSSKPDSAAIFDADGDGVPDVVFSDGDAVTLLSNDGKRGFRDPQIFLPPDLALECHGLVAADFDGDGYMDVAVVNVFDTIAIFPGTGNGFGLAALHTVSKQPESLGVGDFNNDGRPDLIVRDAFAPASVLINQNGFDFKIAGTVAMDSSDGAALGDVDGDGKLDLVVDTINGGLLNRGKGDGTFFAPQMLSQGKYVEAIRDINGDGHADLITYGTVWVNGGGLQFSRVDALGGRRVGDLNGDGRPDLVHTGFWDDFISVVLQK